MIKLRPTARASGNFFKDLQRLLTHLTGKGRRKDGRLAKTLKKIGEEMRRE